MGEPKSHHKKKQAREHLQLCIIFVWPLKGRKHLPWLLKEKHPGWLHDINSLFQMDIVIVIFTHG